MYEKLASIRIRYGVFGVVTAVAMLAFELSDVGASNILPNNRKCIAATAVDPTTPPEGQACGFDGTTCQAPMVAACKGPANQKAKNGICDPKPTFNCETGFTTSIACKSGTWDCLNNMPRVGGKCCLWRVDSSPTITLTPTPDCN